MVGLARVVEPRVPPAVHAEMVLVGDHGRQVQRLLSLQNHAGAFHRVLSLPPLRRLGDISYGIFLWHLVVLAWVFEVTGRQPFAGGFWPVLVETLLGTCAVAAVSWVAMERPLLTLKSRVPV